MDNDTIEQQEFYILMPCFDLNLAATLNWNSQLNQVALADKTMPG